MRDYTLPSPTWIWIGRQMHSQSAASIGRRLLQPEAASEGYAITLAVGHLVLQVLTVRLLAGLQPQGMRLRDTRRGWGSKLVSLWPHVPGFDWPPKRSFSAGGTSIDDLSKRFG